MGSTVRLSALELWNGEPCAAFTLRITILGRRALDYWGVNTGLIWKTLVTMGQVGLKVDGGRVRFSMAPPRTVHHGFLRVLGEIFGPPTSQMMLEFVTPLQIVENVPDGDGRLQKMILAGGDPNLPRLLGELAFHLCDLDLEEREDSIEDFNIRKLKAETAREMVAEAASGLRLARLMTEPIDYGKADSVGGKGVTPIKGFIGYAVLEGDLENVFPYLLALSLWHGGQQGAKGLGEMRLWRMVGNSPKEMPE